MVTFSIKSPFLGDEAAPPNTKRDQKRPLQDPFRSWICWFRKPVNTIFVFIVISSINHRIQPLFEATERDRERRGAIIIGLIQGTEKIAGCFPRSNGKTMGFLFRGLPPLPPARVAEPAAPGALPAPPRAGCEAAPWSLVARVSHVGVSSSPWGYPQWMVYVRENPIEMDDTYRYPWLWNPMEPPMWENKNP